MEFVCIDTLEGDGLHARTLAVFHDGEFKDNVTYALKDTPCGKVVGRQVCCYPSNVRQLFPRDEVLKDLRAESYVGVTLWGFTGKPIGLIAVIGRQPLACQALGEAIMKLVAIRAAGELERMSIEQALSKSEQRYAEILVAVNDGLWEFHLLGKKGFCSPRFYEILGYDNGEFHADYTVLRTLIHPHDVDRVEQEFARSAGQGLGFAVDFRMLRKSGDWLWVCSRGNVVERDAEGKCLRMAGTIFDITQRKQTEARLSIHARIADIFMLCSEKEMSEKIGNVISDAMESPLGFFDCLDEAGDLVVTSISRPVWRKDQEPAKVTILARDTWGKSIWAQVFRTKMAFFSNVKSFITLQGHPVIERHITVPILYHGSTLGFFQVANKKTDYTETDLAFLVAIAQDIAPILSARLQRQFVQNALQKREESYRLQFDENFSVMLLVDPKDGRIVDANRAAEDFYGYSRDQLLAMRISEINTLPDGEIQPLLTFVTEKQGPPFEFQHRLADGSVRDVEVSTSRILLGDGEVLHLIIRDITALKETKKLLLQNHQAGQQLLLETISGHLIYRTILSTTSDGFWLLDLQGTILDINEGYCRQSGYSRQELLGMRPNDLDTNDTAAAFARIQEVVENGQGLLETIHRRKDGSTWEVEASVGSHGRDGRFVVFLRDITLRKKIDKELARSLHEKEVLLQEIHHRVKNNLQVIHSMLSLQAKRISDTTIRQMFNESLNRIYSMALIHQRLCASRDLSRIELKEYLQSLIAAVLANYNCPNVACFVEVESIFLDMTLSIPYGLIINELVSNSLKHAFPDGRKGTIRVSVCRNSHGDNVLVVADNGIGIPTMVDLNDSSSLGLQIVNGLTAQHHGTIKFLTAEGTQVNITFPSASNQQGATYD